MSSDQPSLDRPRGRAVDPDRVADHLLVHQYLRVLGRRPTAQELAEGTQPRRGTRRAGRVVWLLPRVLPRHAARLVAMLARSAG